MNKKAIEDTVICPICQGKKSIVRYKNVSGNRMLLECKNCGVGFLHPFPTEEEREEIYQNNYFSPWGYDQQGSEYIGIIKKRLYRNILKEIEQYANPRKILDVGCAMGYSLEVAKEKGLEPYGVEISEFAGKIAKDKFGDAVKIGDIKDMDFKDIRFDAVTLIDILEHIEEPLLILAKVKSILKENGILAILVPNTSSLSSKVLGRKWPHIHKLPQHLFQFSPNSITVALAKTGFKTESIKPFRKPLTPLYIKNILSYGSSRFLYHISNTVWAMLPKKMKTTGFNLPVGEMLVIARRMGCEKS